MHNKKVFTGCMIRHGALLLAEAILALAVSVILVQGNKIISGVIDEMLSGRQVLFGSFLLQFLIYTVVGTIAAFLQSAAASRYAVEVCTEYRDLVGEKLYRTEYKYFDANYSATLLNKVIGDLGEIASFLETVLPDMIASFIGIFTYAVYIGETNLGLLAVILITYPLIFWIAGKLVKRIRGLQANYRQKTDVMAQIAQDAVSGILVLRSFGIEEVFRKKMHKASVELVENEEKRTQITNTAIVVRKLIQWLPNIISAVYAVWLVSRGGQFGRTGRIYHDPEQIRGCLYRTALCHGGCFCGNGQCGPCGKDPVRRGGTLRRRMRGCSAPGGRERDRV